MFIDQLLNQGSTPVLEQVVRFTGARHRLLVENMSNVDVPGYRQKDLSLTRFQAMLQDRVDRRDSGSTVRFDDIRMAVGNPEANILFHDQNNRSMEQLASDMAKNGLMHNLAIELLRRQFTAMDMALKERVV